MKPILLALFLPFTSCSTFESSVKSCGDACKPREMLVYDWRSDLCVCAPVSR